MLNKLHALRCGQDSTHEKLDSLERRTTLIKKGLSGVRNEIALLHKTYADHRAQPAGGFAVLRFATTLAGDLALRTVIW